MSSRIMPVVLAAVAFLMTFTIRSWHAGLWHLGEAPNGATVSTPQQPAGRTLSIATPSLESRPSLTSIPARESARPHEAPTPPAEPAVRPVDAQNYLSERAREENHSSRMR